MRIVQIIPDFSMGGAEIMCEQLSRELQRTGHEVTAVSLYDTRTPITERLVIDYCKENGIAITSIVKPECKHHPHSLADVAPIVSFVES